MSQNNNIIRLFSAFIFLSFSLFARSLPLSDKCHLAPLGELTRTPELRGTDLTSVASNYEKYLLRYILLYHQKIIIDLVQQGDGSYLDTLHTMLGVDKDNAQACDHDLREIAIKHSRTAEFAAGILDYRRNFTCQSLRISQATATDYSFCDKTGALLN